MCVCVRRVVLSTALLETQRSNWLPALNRIIRATSDLLVLRLVSESLYIHELRIPIYGSKYDELD